MKTRVLVLGADGYVGRRVAAALAASDWAEPIAAGRRAGKGGAPGRITLDATDRWAVRNALAEADAAVNCVAGPAPVMVAGARALREAQDARPGGPLRLVHFSSMAVYGSAEGPVDEGHLLNGDLGPYAAAKASAEQLLTGREEVATLRPGCIYGPGSPQWSVRIARLLRAGRIGDLGVAGDGCSNLVYIDDVVAAVLAALRAGAAGGRAYNLAMDGAPSWNDYFAAYARALGAVPLRRIGRRRLMLETSLLAPALKIAGIAGRRIGMADLPPPIPPSLARLWSQDIRLLSQRARDELGLSWTPLETGLRETALAAAMAAGRGPGQPGKGG